MSWDGSNWETMLERAIAAYNASPEGAIEVAAWITRQWRRFERKPQVIPEFQKFLIAFWKATGGLVDIIRGLLYRATDKIQEHLRLVEQERQRWILWERHARRKFEGQGL